MWLYLKIQSEKTKNGKHASVEMFYVENSYSKYFQSYIIITEILGGEILAMEKKMIFEMPYFKQGHIFTSSLSF